MDKKKFLVNRMIQKQRYAHLTDFFNQIDDLKYSVVKGEVLSYYIYGTFGYRCSSDIDILVNRNDLTIIEHALQSSGFSQQIHTRMDRIMLIYASHQTIPFHKTTSIETIHVDVNFDVFWGEYTGKRIDIDEFLSDSSYINIYGTRVKTISKVKAFIHLILHHYKEMNSIYLLYAHPFITTDMFKDIYLFLSNNPDISPRQLATVSWEYGITQYMYYMLYFTKRVFQESWLDAYISECKCLEGIALLNKYGLNEDEQKEWNISFENRLDNPNLKSVIESQLLPKDLEKIIWNMKIFN